MLFIEGEYKQFYGYLFDLFIGIFEKNYYNSSETKITSPINQEGSTHPTYAQQTVMYKIPFLLKQALQVVHSSLLDTANKRIIGFHRNCPAEGITTRILQLFVYINKIKVHIAINFSRTSTQKIKYTF